VQSDLRLELHVGPGNDHARRFVRSELIAQDIEEIGVLPSRLTEKPVHVR
jgi:hypothetical protein